MGVQSLSNTTVLVFVVLNESDSIFFVVLVRYVHSAVHGIYLHRDSFVTATAAEQIFINFDMGEVY
jgi:hypothetical protein